jgi:hypothetical protein
MHIIQRGDSTMKVKYAERGTFDAEKATRALIELTNRIKKQNIQDKKNDKSKDNTN